MNKITIDFETRSAVNLKKQGAWVYSEHDSTSALCLAIKEHGYKTACLMKKEELVLVKHVASLANIINRADIIEAHNAQFEYAIWTNVCVKKYGWPELPVHKLRCSAAKAAMHSLPRSLENACAALRLPVQKDMEGYKLMMKMSKPRRINNKDRKEWLSDPSLVEMDNHFYHPEFGCIYMWHDDPADFERLYQYCMNDVIVEEMLSDAIRDLPEKEQRIWHLDLAINYRGVQADTTAARAMIKMVDDHEEKLLKRLRELTYGKVKTAKQVEALRNHLRGLGIDLPDLSAETIKKALKGDIGGQGREILEIRSSLGRSSAAKYRSVLDRCSATDNRVRGSLLYHGAGTGRWSGAGIQPQNFPSRIKIERDPEEMLGVILTGGLELHNALYDDDPMATAGAVTRSVLTAAEGKELIVADYSAIEGRGLAWLAGEETELEVYRKDQDPYIASAAMILHKAYDDVTKEERQSPGKISVLACGYGGGAGAVRAFGGEGMSDEEILTEIVRPWRDAHPKTVEYWRALEKACFEAVEQPGKITGHRGALFTVRNNFMMLRLPSGRILFYYDPDIRPVLTSWGELKESVTYMTVNGVTKKWERTNTYGGKLAENITQAICRDIMAEAMLRLDDVGYEIVLTVHDEIVTEMPEGRGSVEELEHIMCIQPKWAYGFPIKASGWKGKRYKK